MSLHNTLTQYILTVHIPAVHCLIYNSEDIFQEQNTLLYCRIQNVATVKKKTAYNLYQIHFQEGGASFQKAGEIE